DLTPGWQAFGGTNNLQVVGKLTWLATPTTKLSLSFIDEARSNQSYDRRYQLNYGGDPWSRVNNLMDSLGVQGSRNFANVLQASGRAGAQLPATSWVQQIGRSNSSVRVGQQEFLRNTCTIWQGVCIGNRYWEGNF